MKEPFVNSVVYDLTSRPSDPPADDGYNIIAAVYSELGPIEKTKVLSQQDFLDKYMDGGVLPTTNMSAQFIYKLLEQNPVHIVRACPIEVLEGITCKGDSLLFDKSYNLIERYSTFSIDGITDDMDVYYFLLNGVNYYTGTLADIPAEDLGDSQVQISETKSIDELFNALINIDTYSALSDKVVSSGNAVFSSTLAVTKFSSNIGKKKLVAQQNKYYRHDLSDFATLGFVNELDNLRINNYTYYFSGINIHSTSSMYNPVRITSPDNKESMCAWYYFLKVIAESGAKSYGCFNFRIKAAESINDVTISSITNIPSLAGSSNTDFIVYNNSTIKATDGAQLTISINGVSTTYVVGTTDIPDAIVISTSNISTYKFITKVVDNIISRNRSLFSSNDPNKLVLVNPGSNLYLLVGYEYITSCNVVTVKQPSQVGSIYNYYLSTDANNSRYIEYDFLWITIGTYLYYTGQPTDDFDLINQYSNSIRMSSGSVSEAEFKSLLYTNAYISQSIVGYNGSYVILGSLPSISQPSNMIITTNVVTQSTVDQFAVVQKFPATRGVFQFNYSKDADDNRIYNLRLNYKSGTVVNDWTMSFIPGVTDGYGVDMWYERVVSDYFKVVLLDESGESFDSYSSVAWGSKVEVPEPSESLMSEAISSVTGYEDGVYYDMVCDSGVSDVSYAAVCSKVAAELNAYYPVSLPPYTGIDDLISFRLATDIGEYNSVFLAASDRVTINGFSVIFPGSYKLITSVLKLFRNKSIEFAPLFDINNGSVSMVNPIQSFDKESREDLLDYHINSVKGGKGSDPYYINNNLTAIPNKSYLEEDQIMRSVNTAVHIMDQFAKYYKAEYNNEETRKLVVRNADDLIKNRLFVGKKYTPVQYVVKCDEINNTISVIDDNKLIIDLYAKFSPSIKEVLIRHFIVPLSQTI